MTNRCTDSALASTTFESTLRNMLQSELDAIKYTSKVKTLQQFTKAEIKKLEKQYKTKIKR